jgi:transcriptional regulator with XRE-family HTH domain
MCRLLEAMKNLRRRREAKKLSRWELAKKADVSPQTISDIELKGTNPRVDIAAKLAKALGTTIDDLMGKTRRAS